MSFTAVSIILSFSFLDVSLFMEIIRDRAGSGVKGHYQLSSIQIGDNDSLAKVLLYLLLYVHHTVCQSFSILKVFLHHFYQITHCTHCISNAVALTSCSGLPVLVSL